MTWIWTEHLWTSILVFFLLSSCRSAIWSWAAFSFWTGINPGVLGVSRLGKMKESRLLYHTKPLPRSCCQMSTELPLHGSVGVHLGAYVEVKGVSIYIYERILQQSGLHVHVQGNAAKASSLLLLPALMMISCRRWSQRNVDVLQYLSL